MQQVRMVQTRATELFSDTGAKAITNTASKRKVKASQAIAAQNANLMSRSVRDHHLEQINRNEIKRVKGSKRAMTPQVQISKRWSSDSKPPMKHGQAYADE